MPGAADAVLARLERLHPKVIDLTLTRIARLLAALGDPQRALPPVVHVAGTNGKGSVIALLAAMLEAAGRRVHVYTSPHLVRFGERVRLAGRDIDDAALITLLEECERANGAVPITFFEITTAAAFLAFARTPADVLLLETGLGGRLDATNMVDRPAVTAITPIGFDHQAFLGDDLASIAGEKAGILKAGVPAVVAAQHPDAGTVIADRARALGAPLSVAGTDWTAAAEGDGMRFRCGDTDWSLPRPALAGPHQIVNAGVALACLDHLPGPKPDRDAVARGLRAAHWPARLQPLAPESLGVTLPPGSSLHLDGAHNEQAAEAVAASAPDLWDGPIDLILGMLDSKDPAALLGPLGPLAGHVWTVPVPDAPAGRPAADLAAAARARGLAATAMADVPDALTAIAARGTRARVLICGSLYLAGWVLARVSRAP